MRRKTEQVSVVRCVLMLVALSLGLSGCKTCENLKGKLPFFGRRPQVVESQPPMVGEDAPMPAPAPTPRPKVVAPSKEESAAPRPEQPPKVEEALQTVHFDYDSSVLRENARRILDRNIDWLKRNRDVRVQIEGHCDERGTEEYNLHLGERRANSVKRYLVTGGIDPVRLFTISYGEERPVDPGRGESAWAKNRRGQFSRY